MHKLAKFGFSGCLTVMLISASLLCASCLSFAQETKCDLAIDSPRQGDHVGAIGSVKGQARIPSKAFLWIMAHRKGFSFWWPQPGGPLEIKNGRWETEVYYGVGSDIGSTFEVAAVVVNEEENAKLQKWVEMAPADNYRPIPLPRLIEACAVRKISVLKAE